MSEINKKDLVLQYRERKMVGGVCAIRNTQNDKRLIFMETDLVSGQNRFDFMAKTGSCYSFKMQRDWQAFGAAAFAFEVLETLEKNEDQTAEDFHEELKVLEAMTKEKFEKAQLYG